MSEAALHHTSYSAHNSTGDFDPAYSPKGKRIAYSGYDGKELEIYTIKVGGGGRFNVTDNSTDDFYPSYSPSGKKIAYVTIATAPSVWRQRAQHPL
jgi:Tol biopolymer transport system component